MNLPINHTKCQHLAIGRTTRTTNYTTDTTPISQDSEVRDLGIITRSDLKTKSHTKMILQRGYRMLWALRRSISLWTRQTVPKLLTTFIRPILEYGAPAYFPITKGECSQLERIQRIATRLIPDLRNMNYIHRCQELELFTLEYRRSRMEMIFMYRLIKQQQHQELSILFEKSNMTTTRGHSLKLTKPRLDRLTNVSSFRSRSVNLWNSLPSNVISAQSVEIFKCSLDKYLWEKFDTWRSEPEPGGPYPRLPHTNPYH